MRMKIYVNGAIFESKNDKDVTAEEAKDMIYKQIGDLTKLEMETEGGFIIIPGNALQNSVLVFTDK